MPLRPCLDCGKPTPKTRCAACEAARQHARNQSRPHYQGDWAALSKTLRDVHVAQHGWVCPGWQVPPHPSTDLTVDHVTARSRDQLQVLCRPCNARKSVSERNT